jgi:phospholipid/cholesterol/gamma-HCH transport system substrate-binding protein
METKVNLGLVGAFVLVLGLALVAGVLWLASGGLWQKKFDTYLAIEHESVAGLNINAPVKYNGVELGRVQKIELDAMDPQRVNLYLAIEHDAPVRQNTVAVLKAQGLTGIAYLELSGGTPGAPPLTALPGQSYPVIPTKSSLSTRLELVLTRVLAKLDDSSNSLNGFLSEKNQQAFASALADIARISRTVAARSPQIDAAIVAGGHALQQGATASDQFTPTLARISQSAEALARMGDSVTQTSQGAGVAVRALSSGAQRLGEQTLPELDRLLGELNVLSASLRRLSEQTERAPSGLVFRHAPVLAGPGETRP